ncbi:tryptophan synthase subunit alpha [Thalassomonas sp. M1454]|uniref:tryptophan synthase subunit alpha n=1 Tax=Thalassomonas sp. M1454 TaxID=2594477 RepID=UPI00117D68B1|nr:tryptophan synthase subunit alpha [Thalassomonas sp. M1454]TRX55737.1 tryptophan synthase subunit alpha [Thalassomonas sp. M1454]
MTQLKSASANRYEQSFNNLKAKQQGAFIPFVTIGDPNAEQSFEIIKTLIDNGADALELGIPFSDPSADGLTIQYAAQRALAANINTDVCIEIIKKVRDYNADIPIGLLLYANLVFARGIDVFYRDMSDAGVDSVLIADVPIREGEKFRNAAIANNIAPIFIAPPNASNVTLEKVATLGQGYTYVLSRAGVTGTEVVANMPGKDLIDTLNQYNAPAPVLGFGISTPEHVKEAIANGAKGAISGSAVVKIIENNLDNNQQMLIELGDFVRAMKAAT